MWIVLTLLAMICYTAYDLFAKYKVSGEDDLAVYRFRFAISLLELVCLIVIRVFGLGESGQSIIQIMLNHPIIILVATSTFISELLYLVAKKYVGIIVEGAVASINAPLVFTVLLIISLFTDKLSSSQESVTPLKLLPVIVMIICIIILPNIGKKKETTNEIIEHKKLIIGMIIVFIAVVFDVSDSIFAAILLNGGEVGYFDFISVAYLFGFIYGCGALGVAKHKGHQVRRIFNKDFFPAMGFSFLVIMYTLLCVIVLAMEPVKSSVLWIAFPILPGTLSIIILKERYSWKQYLCIGLILVSSMAFSVMDLIG